MTFRKLALAALAAGAFLAAHAQTTVPVGYTGPLTGSASSWGIGMAEGMKMAFADAGTVQIGGKPYKFVLDAYDDAYNTQTAVANSQRMIQEKKVKFAATMGGAIGVVTEPVMSSAKVLQFHLGAAEAFLGKDKPLSLRSHMSSLDAFYVYWPWVANKYPQVKTVALFQPNDDTGRASQVHEEAAIKKTRLSIVANERVPRDVTDFYPILTKVLEKKPDAISFYTPPGQQPIAAKQARELGFKGLIMLPSMEAGSVVTAMGPAAEGVLNTVALTYPMTDRARKVHTNWVTARKSAPPALLLDGYNIGEMLIRAAVAAGTVENTTAVYNALQKLPFKDSVFGKACFHEVKGIRNAMVNSMAITSIKAGKEELLDVAQPPCK
ncbi:ABC transporter substrate-binding protein [Ramlibacter sp.]|uniref:ABC transporter substrate-binding protein n=1 Tax=Ramlibacter sp. TaxID=1917967 RepID=UPI003D10F913